MKTLNYAIIGYGGIAKTHALASYDANIMLNLPFKLKLKSIYTRTKKEINLPDVDVFTDIEKMLSDDELDFVCICTPNDSHYEYVKLCVKYNKHIYCEKPLSDNLEDAKAMTQLVNETNLFNATALIYRFLPTCLLMKEEILKNTIGDIIDFKALFYHKSYLSAKKKGAWRTLKSSGGGAGLDLGIHFIDLINFVVGSIKDTKSEKRIFFTDRNFVDEIATYRIELNNGVTGCLEASRVYAQNKQQNELEIFGTKGNLKANMENPHELSIYLNDTNTTTIIRNDSLNIRLFYPDVRSYLGFFQSAHTASIAEFAYSIYSGEKSKHLADFNDSLFAQQLI